MVRYADTPTVSVTSHIEAPPAAVWSLVTDIELPARFSNEFQGAEWLDPTPRPGARFVGRNRHPEMEWTWETTCTVTTYEPDRSFGYAVSDVERPAAHWRFDLEPHSTGTHLTFTAVMGPGPSGLTPAIERMPEKEEKIVARRLDEWLVNMEATVAGIKALAESR